MKTVEEYVSPEQTAEWVETWVRGRAADAGVNDILAHLRRLSALEAENKRLREVLIVTYLKISLLAGTDPSDVEVIRSALSGEG